MKLLIGIPAYNEEKKIGKVIGSLPRKLPGISRIDILVVDDGSADRTARVAQSRQVSVVRHILNRGLGGALKTVFSYAVRYDYDLLVTFDADGQHHPGDIRKLVNPLLYGQSDVVIGTRWSSRGKQAPFARYLINRLANFYTLLLFGVKTADSQSGFRAFNKKAVSHIKLTSDGMEVSSEFFREIYRHKLVVIEVPVTLIYTDYSLKKGQSLTNAPFLFFRLILRLLK